MKIVNILGGLGNQMFEYAMYLALKDAHPQEDILVCTRSFGGYGLHNGLEIQRIFDVELPEASLLQLANVAYPFFNYKTWQIMRHFLPVRKSMTRGGFDIPFDYSQVIRDDSCYYEGYWQNELNFAKIRHIVLDVYKFPAFKDSQNTNLAEELSVANSVSCHVRRGDYLKESVMCVCSPEYYANAIKEMNKKVNPDLYCIFSDDIKWCRENLQDLLGSDKRVIYVDWNKGENSYCDMQLMSLCNHNIIANSSFSWWGAWLNQHEDKIVMTPKSWINGTIFNDPLCSTWLRIDV